LIIRVLAGGGAKADPLVCVCSQFLCSTGRPFLRPDLPVRLTPRADAVKAGRRSPIPFPLALARPRLDGGKHGVILRPQRGLLRPPLNGCYGGGGSGIGSRRPSMKI
jgi:hypothetical protein